MKFIEKYINFFSINLLAICGYIIFLSVIIFDFFSPTNTEYKLGEKETLYYSFIILMFILCLCISGTIFIEYRFKKNKNKEIIQNNFHKNFIFIGLSLIFSPVINIVIYLTVYIVKSFL